MFNNNAPFNLVLTVVKGVPPPECLKCGNDNTDDSIPPLIVCFDCGFEWEEPNDKELK